MYKYLLYGNPAKPSDPKKAKMNATTMHGSKGHSIREGSFPSKHLSPLLLLNSMYEARPQATTCFLTLHDIKKSVSGLEMSLIVYRIVPYTCTIILNSTIGRYLMFILYLSLLILWKPWLASTCTCTVIDDSVI